MCNLKKEKKEGEGEKILYFDVTFKKNKEYDNKIKSTHPYLWLNLNSI